MIGYPYSSGNPGANVPASITVRGRIGARVVLSDVLPSYSGAPAGGNLTIAGQRSGRGFDFDITAAGVTPLLTSGTAVEFDVGEDVVLTLAAGGAAVTGKINCAARWEPA